MGNTTTITAAGACDAPDMKSNDMCYSTYCGVNQYRESGQCYECDDAVRDLYPQDCGCPTAGETYDLATDTCMAPSGTPGTATTPAASPTASTPAASPTASTPAASPTATTPAASPTATPVCQKGEMNAPNGNCTSIDKFFTKEVMDVLGPGFNPSVNPPDAKGETTMLTLSKCAEKCNNDIDCRWFRHQTAGPGRPSCSIHRTPVAYENRAAVQAAGHANFWDYSHWVCPSTYYTDAIFTKKTATDNAPSPSTSTCSDETY